jgi:hypothetical protein
MATTNTCKFIIVINVKIEYELKYLQMERFLRVMELRFVVNKRKADEQSLGKRLFTFLISYTTFVSLSMLNKRSKCFFDINS